MLPITEAAPSRRPRPEAARMLSGKGGTATRGARSGCLREDHVLLIGLSWGGPNKISNPGSICATSPSRVGLIQRVSTLTILTLDFGLPSAPHMKCGQFREAWLSINRAAIAFRDGCSHLTCGALAGC